MTKLVQRDSDNGDALSHLRNFNINVLTSLNSMTHLFFISCAFWDSRSAKHDGLAQKKVNSNRFF